MIGGNDIVIARKIEARHMRAFLTLVIEIWPESVFEYDGVDDGIVMTSEAIKNAPPVPNEFFVYRDRATCNSWTVSGKTHDNSDGMIYVIALAGEVTFVVDERHGRSTEIVLLTKVAWATMDMNEAP